MRDIFVRILLVLCVAWMCLTPVAGMNQSIAAERATPVAQAKQIRDFSRLTFTWKTPVYLTAESEGNTLVIHFEKPAEPEMSAALKTLGGVVKSKQLSADGQTLTLTLNGLYRVRSFVSGNVNGVDLLPMSETAMASKPLKNSTTQKLKPLPKPELARNFSLTKKEAKAYPPPKIERSNLHQEEESLAAIEPSEGTESKAEDVTAKLNNAEASTPTAPASPPAANAPLATKPAETAPAPAAKTPAETPVSTPLAQPAAAPPASPPAPKKPMDSLHMTDAQALQEMQAEHQAEPDLTAEDFAKMSTMTDAQAMEYMRQKKKNTPPTPVNNATPATQSSAEEKKTAAETKPQPLPEVKAEAKPAKAQTPAPQTPAKASEDPAAEAANKEPAQEVAAQPAEPTLAVQKTVEQKPEESKISAKAAHPTSEEIVVEPPKEEVTKENAAQGNEEQPNAEQELKIEVPNTDSVQDQPETTEPHASVEVTPALSAAQDAATQSENGFRVRATLEDEILTMTFPWLERTAGAAFVRDGMAWVVFSTPAKLDLDEVNSLMRAGATVTQMDMPGATVLYMPVNIGSGVRMESVEGTFKWVVRVLPARQTSQAPLKPELSTEPPLKPHVFLPLLEVGTPVRITDPVVGDKMDVLPVYTADVGISPARYFVDFALLETSQGVVVQRYSDSTEVLLVRNGVRISTEQGAVITPGLPLVEEVKKTTEVDTDKVFLPYKAWLPPEDKDFMKEINRLQKTLVSEETKNDLPTHLEIARLYLAQGYAQEAIGYLNNIKRIDPQYYIDKHLSAMHGATNFLLQRYSDAAQDFSVPEIRDFPEAGFWQDMLSELLGNPNKKFDYDANYEPYIKEYPPVFRQRIGIIAADRAIAAKEYNAALKIFDQMNEHKLINEVADYINYLMGKIALETQQPDDAYKIWNTLLEGKGSEFVKVRTEFSLIVEQMKRNAIPENEAIDRLERLAIRWRGDNLELAVLSTLNEIYKQKKDWPNAIRIARALNEAFPNTVAAVDAARNMDDAFIAMFDKGETGNLGTLDQLFVYNEYRDLIPQDEVGDRIVDNITNKMIDMDMVDQAEEILEQRMRYRFEHQARSRVGAKLARIYLMDRKPEQALTALQLSVFGTLPEALLQERKYLAAQALLDLNRYEDFELLLKDDDSEQANAYRMQAAWQQKDWQKVSEWGETILQNRKNATAALTDLQAKVVVRLATAYVALEENTQLAYLRDYFTPLMKGKHNEKAFEYLTRPYMPLTTSNFDEVVKSLEDAHEFLNQMEQPQAAQKAPAGIAAKK